MKTKRQLQKEHTRKKIIETAYQIYSEQGFSATTAVIAKEAGVSHGTIFAHFSSLDELLCCLIQDFGDALGSEIHRLAETKDNIEELLKTHLDLLARHEKFYIRLIAERSLLPEDARLTFSNIQSIVAFHFNKAFERESSTIKDVPIPLLFNTWMGLVHYYLLNKDLFSPDTPVLERYGSKLTETFLELIKK
ncbi:TetR/AcrR family transcriptional regulator [Lacrimispora saccharolytica]|uniref:Transcriptional regulator, TetR family n=1 Tax=Lacrimispora saccharolytica (strain ATCC 35040 / DSM 2544 / NRCC 2533 / WM1) TaxID=610130 RepID=D9R859_LACSW|nr:TetR/AcrR family transcriptional regulator [Lacrimispora saccharolytica]ADL03811.1 transcriptional regulator, TetR family [[Clostridium] saccharolyticum WM1]QRV21872.1 TetR/AcrR family transcriptional regulator [Lacrimispora saccharolytica]